MIKIKNEHRMDNDINVIYRYLLMYNLNTSFVNSSYFFSELMLWKIGFFYLSLSFLSLDRLVILSVEVYKWCNFVPAQRYICIDDGIKYTSRVAREIAILFQRERSRSLEMAKSYVSINFNESDNMFDL